MSRGLRRFYVDQNLPREGALLRLSSRETFHLHRVLRLSAGDRCQIFNRNGKGAEGVIEALSPTEGARLRVEKIFPSRERFLFLKVAQALPQKRKMDDLVKKAEELGVSELWVLETARTVVKMRPEAREGVKERWERIVVEAAKQSGNSILTRVEGPLPFEKVLEEKLRPSDAAFLFHPDPSGFPFQGMVEKLGASPVFLFFGPEGGFTEREVRLAESRGCRKVFLGDSTLRLETAFIGVISAIRFLVPS